MPQELERLPAIQELLVLQVQMELKALLALQELELELVVLEVPEPLEPTVLKVH